MKGPHALSEGEQRVVRVGSGVLTSVALCELTGADPASVTLAGSDGAKPYYQLRVGPGGSMTFADRVALPWGLAIICQSGEVAISVAYQ